MSIDWEVVIGLEVHCQLLTREKLFCIFALISARFENSNKW
jgi:Asp-tRNA(Asn)/Glu-tRNA(Gln) amidotransferase B subunit